MGSTVNLPGLERLKDVCRRLDLRLKTTPPSQAPLKAGTLIAGLPFDPVLAAIYSQVGYASFATDVAGIVLTRCDDLEKKIEEDNHWWSTNYRKQLALPTLVFAGEPLMAYHYATVPDLADDQGQQPVVHVDVYEEPYAMPVASNADRFLDAYSRYLEALMAIPNARREAGLLVFPWQVPDIIARDGRLVELIQEGRFDSLTLNRDAQAWARQVVNAGISRT